MVVCRMILVVRKIKRTKAEPRTKWWNVKKVWWSVVWLSEKS